MRALSAEEQALWAQVTATIRPLSREPLEAGTEEPPEARIAKPSSAKAPKGRIWQRPASPPPPAPPPRPTIANTLDSGWDRRLRNGSVAPDRVIDLHGHNLDGAWSAIDRGLERAIAAHDRLVLLITGHARAGDPPIERGRIRAAVGDWLAASRHAPRIAAVRGAHPRHGGGGSLYVILRRA